MQVYLTNQRLHHPPMVKMGRGLHLGIEESLILAPFSCRILKLPLRIDIKKYFRDVGCLPKGVFFHGGYKRNGRILSFQIHNTRVHFGSKLSLCELIVSVGVKVLVKDTHDWVKECKNMSGSLNSPHALPLSLDDQFVKKLPRVFQQLLGRV